MSPGDRGMRPVHDPQAWRPALERYWQGLDLGVPLEHLWQDPARQRPSALCYVERDGRYLMLRRRKEPFRGLWTAPGGKVEPGEAPDEAIRREIREETGLTLQRLELRLVTAETGPHPAYNWLLFLFRGTAAPGPPRAGVEGELRWFTPAELEAAPIPEVDRRLLPWLLGPADGVPRLGTIEYGAQGELKHVQLEPPGRKAGPAAEENL